MRKQLFNTILLGAASALGAFAQTSAQHEMLTTDSSKAPIVEPALNHLDVDFEAGETFLGSMANTD